MRTATIYMIKCNSTGLTYYGSTIQRFVDRKSGHRRDYKRWLSNFTKNNGKKVHKTTACDVMKQNNYYFQILNEFEIDELDITKMIEMEADYIFKNNCVNKINPLTGKYLV